MHALCSLRSRKRTDNWTHEEEEEDDDNDDIEDDDDDALEIREEFLYYSQKDLKTTQIELMNDD